MTDDRFFERLRDDAASLRYEVDDVAAGRIAARIRGRIRQQTVAEILVTWLRPVGVGIAALAAAAVIALAVSDRPADVEGFGNEVVEISMAGGNFHVGE